MPTILTAPFQSPPPDDSGFLRQMITTLIAQYNADPKRVFVAGFSSGGLMAERVGVELSDIVAAISPIAGQIAGQHVPPVELPGTPAAPISVQEWHGTADTGMPPCNGAFVKFSSYKIALATVDQTFNYWTQQNACTQLETTQTLCTNGAATPGLAGNDATACTNNVEVQFVWEQGVNHSNDPANNATRWQFFAAHPKP